MQVLELIQSTQSSLGAILPELLLCLGFLLSLCADVFLRRKSVLPFIVMASLLSSLFFSIQRKLNFTSDVLLFNNFLKLHESSINISIIASITCILCFIVCINLFKKNKLQSELLYLFPVFLMASNFMIFSNHLLMYVIGVEFISLLSYIYIAYSIKSERRAESSVKYILYGIMASAIMLWGLSGIYQFSGDLQLNSSFLSTLSKVESGRLVLPLIFFIAGLLYKISAFPMHYFVPDVYEGAEPKVLALISTLPKIAGFALLLNFSKSFSHDWQNMRLIWPNFPWVDFLVYIAIVTLFVGNLSALSQKNLKRIFAYSSISHTGYLLMAIASFSAVAEQSLWFYLSIYAISNIAIFVVLHILEEKYSIYDLEALQGFFKSDRSMSFLVVILLGSFVGLPPLAGFIAKFYVFSAAFEHYIQSANTSVLLLLIAAALNTVISLFYYFNIAKSIFLKDTSAQWEPRGEALQGFNTERIVVYVLVLSLIIFGIFPNLLIGLF